MSELTLDEAIQHCLEVAENCEEQAKQCDSDDRYERHVMHEDAKCATEHRQLAEWLMEVKDLREENKFLISEFDRLIKERVKERAELLKKSEQIAEYKRLLKAAVEDMTGMQFGKECKVCSKKLLPNECPIHNNISCIFEKDFKWRYTDEAKKLLKED